MRTTCHVLGQIKFLQLGRSMPLKSKCKWKRCKNIVKTRGKFAIVIFSFDCIFF